MKMRKSVYWKLLAKYLKPQWFQVLLLGIGLRLINPQIVRFFIDKAQAGEQLRILLSAGGLFIGVALVQQLMAIGSTYVSQNLGWTSTNAILWSIIEVIPLLPGLIVKQILDSFSGDLGLDESFCVQLQRWEFFSLLILD